MCVGKGGVGKTSVAAATALRSAELGYRTIILSTDSAHSLSDSFEANLGNEPQLIRANLWGQEPDVSQTIEERWGTIQKYVAALMAWRGVDEIVADDMAVLPGMEELSNLLYIVNYERRGDYDVAVIDCAPTGETLRLLSFPEILHWWMTRMFPIGRKVSTMISPLAKAVIHMPTPTQELFDSIEELYCELEQMHVLLTDKEKTSVRLVVNPEKMVIKEAQRALTCLNLYGFYTDLVICNRLIPDKVDDKYFHIWKENQKKHLEMLKDSFSPLPIVTVPLLDQEIVGTSMLEIMGKTIYGENNPSDFFYRGELQRVQKEGKYYVLALSLPFADKQKIDLAQSGDELTIQVGKFRRNVILPHALVGLSVVEAGMEDSTLKVKFLPKKRKAVKS